MRPRRVRRGLLTGAAAALLSLLVLALGIRWGDPALYPPGPGEETVTVFLISNGFHSGLVLPRAEAGEVAGRDREGAVLAVATRFAAYRWIETGWGDDRFYRTVPTLGGIDWLLGLRALFRPGNLSVMHVVGVEEDPRETFRGSDIVRLDLSPAGFGRLVATLDRSFARDQGGIPQDLGPGLYGPSLFYRAAGTFSIFNLCNHWTARLLDAAGVPVSPLFATLPRGLILDLKLRSGLSAEPRDLPAIAGTH